MGKWSGLKRFYKKADIIQGLDELYLVSLEEEVYYKEIYNTKCTFKIIKRNRGKGYEFNVQKGLWDYIKKIKPNKNHKDGPVQYKDIREKTIIPTTLPIKFQL